jgi:threonine/homoserine/homoserine lactone efflux protein
MTYDVLIALLGFAFVTSVTPGPNNLMLIASGVNFGFARTLPHMLGISLGQAVMLFVVGVGLSGALHAWPQAVLALKIASLGYMLWLAWKIATAAAPGQGRAGGVPFGFLQAMAFQWVNPKAWAIALGATTAYAPQGDARSMALISAVFVVVNLPSVSIWAAAGEGLRGWLANPARLRGFNWTMAALLVASLLPVIWL